MLGFTLTGRGSVATFDNAVSGGAELDASLFSAAVALAVAGATGGYERGLCDDLLAAKVPASRVDPSAPAAMRGPEDLTWDQPAVDQPKPT